ncbi:5 TM domain-containing transmembrane protein [Acrasis kona]|uniref:BOS complex subunit TMEM147 n=1 Tax=Acrasis kona TaxID=1008807 RepID=A0AAW2YKR4_9EUKA
MTFLHFVTCAVLTYAPTWVIYKSSEVSEGGYPNIVYGVIAYALTLFAKLLLMATFLPPETTTTVASSDSTLHLRINLVQEFVKTVIAGLDILGVYMIINKAVGRNVVKIVGIGLGWSLGENLLSRLIPLWMGARGLEFEWKHIQMALLSNINILLYISFASLVYLYSRKIADSLTRTLRIQMAFLISIPFIIECIKHLFGVYDSWTILFIHLVLVVLGAFISYGMHVKYSK